MIVAYRCSMFNPDRLLSCRDNSKLSFLPYRATVTLHQGQIRVIETTMGIYSVYLHAKVECHSLNMFRYITIKVHVKAFVNFESAIETMSEGRGHRITSRINRQLMGLSLHQT